MLEKVLFFPRQWSIFYKRYQLD